MRRGSMAKCPCCKQTVEDAKGSVELGEDGLPIALSVTEGIGLPVVDQAVNLRVLLNGERQDSCVGFDRRRKLLWRNQRDATGKYLIRDSAFVIEQVSGDITLEVIA